MKSKSCLVDLPNELFELIFRYLNSVEILNSFGQIQSRRFKNLIQFHIKRLDICQQSIQWIQSYLPLLLRNDRLIDIRLEMRQLSILREQLLSMNFNSMELMDFCGESEIIKELRQKLKKLILRCSIGYEDGDLILDFFQSDSQLEYLTIQNSTLNFFEHDFEINKNLVYLSIESYGLKPIFDLLIHLPNLRQLKAQVTGDECIVQQTPHIENVESCQNLRSVTFTGWIKYFEHFESFFLVFGSTIESLSLDIHFMYRMFDGKQLETSLLAKIPRLSSLDFIIKSFVVDESPIEIETFQSLAWQQFNPVVYSFDIEAQQHMIFTVPYKSKTFDFLSRDFFSNQSISLNMKSAHELVMMNTIPLNSETFLFIQKVFINIKTIEIREPIRNYIAEDDDDDEEEIVSILSIDEDLSLQFPNITKFSLEVQHQRIDYKSFYRLLYLFPNLIELRLNIHHPVFQDIFKHRDENNYLAKTTFNSIKQLNIADCSDDDMLTDEQIHILFPNVIHANVSNEMTE